MQDLKQEVAQPAAAAAMPPLAIEPASFPKGDTARTFTYDNKPYKNSIPDPYAALEEPTKETMDWVHAQDAYARQKLKSGVDYKNFSTRIQASDPKSSVDAPISAGDYYFSRERILGDGKASLVVRSKLDETVRKLVDPNLTTGQSVEETFFPSPDGKLIIVGVSQGGGRNADLMVLDSATGKEVSPRLPRTRYTNAAWLPDSSGFYFTQWPAPGTVPVAEEGLHRKLFFTKLGSTSQVEVPYPGLDKADFISATTAETRPWAIIENYTGTVNTLRLKSTTSDLEVNPIPNAPSAEYAPMFTPRGLGIRTNQGAPNGKYIEVELPKEGSTSMPEPKEVIPEKKGMILRDVKSVGDLLVANYSDNLVSRLFVFDATGKQLREIQLPDVGTVTKITTAESSSECFFQFSNFTTPGKVMKLDPVTGKTELFSKEDGVIDANTVKTSQIWAKSKDGTQIPAFVIEPKDAVRNKTSPTLLIGYGGFGQSQDPKFTPRVYAAIVSWVAQGGTVVVANLRGGGEFGEMWHQEGMLDKKQNVIDDYFAVARKLFDLKITSHDHLAAYGASNGGLLVTAALNQKPELFAAAAANVPYTDMLRYHRTKTGAAYVPEYGSADNSQRELEYLLKYSPYHNIKHNKKIPPIIVTNAEEDILVDPFHARKYFARLLAEGNLRGDAFLLTKFGSGHNSAGEDREITNDNTAQTLAFLWKNTSGSKAKPKK